MKKHMANILTACRILGSIVLLFLPVCSLPFCIIYSLCGLSDMIDGTIARRTNSTSEWGAKLDTAADFVLITVALIKLLPIIDVPLWVWLWGGVIALIKIGNILWGYVLKKQFIALHTLPNKMTGLALFLFPLTLPLAEVRYSFFAVCSLATFAAVHEGVSIAADHKNK